jgi:hypothetical protein
LAEAPSSKMDWLSMIMFIVKAYLNVSEEPKAKILLHGKQEAIDLSKVMAEKKRWRTI